MKSLRKPLYFILAFVIALSLGLTSCSPQPAATQANTESVSAPTTAEAPPTAPQEATTAPAAQDTAAEKTLVIAANTDVSGWDPATSVYWLANEVIVNTHDMLLDYALTSDVNGNPVRDVSTLAPGLAETWDVNDDMTQFTFHIRENAKFNNGDPVTAAAVKASFERLLKIAGMGSWLLTDVAFVSKPEQMVVDDDYTLTFKLEKSNPLFLKTMNEMNMAITNVAQIQKEGGTTEEEQNKWASAHPTGSGPYMLDSYTPDVELVLKANPYYWGEKPYFTKVVYKIVPDIQNREMMLKQGDINVMYEVPEKDIADLKADSTLQAYAIPTLGTLFFTLGGNGKPWSEPKLRQAIAYAIPYDTIINEVTYGLAKKATSWIPEGLDGHIDASPYTYDLEKAKQLLSEAGYPDGKGLPPIKAYVRQGISADEQASVYIQAELQKIGITMQIETVTQDAQGQVLTKHEPGLFAFQMWIPYVPDPGYALYWSYKSSDSGCCNYVSYSNPRVDELIDKILVDYDNTTRVPMIEEVQRILAEDPPQIMLYNPTWNISLQADIKGYSYYPDTLVRLGHLSK